MTRDPNLEKSLAEADLMRQVYEEYDEHQFRDYVATREVAADPRVRQIDRHIGTGKRILDIGISRGDFALFLAARGNQVVGLDISARAVEICRERGLEAYRVNIETQPLPVQGDFDVVLLLEVIEHLIDPLPVLRKIRAVLRPAGQLILSTPNAAYLKWRLQFLLGRMPDFGENRAVAEEPRSYNLLHKTPLTIRDLEDLLRQAGLDPRHLEPEDYGATPLWGHFGLRHLRNWARAAWPSVFAGAIVVCASPAAGPESDAAHPTSRSAG